MATIRGAFSLLELLVVLGIVMAFLGLTLGAVMKTPRVNAAVGTQHLVADLIRQAGHSARTSGTPVVIEIYHDSPDILGISQVPIQRETFENIAPGSTLPDALSASASDPAGFTGRGLRIADCSPTATGVVTVVAAANRQQQLYRVSTNGRIEGFYLACAVRPPVPTRLGGGLYPQSILLAAVNSTDPSATTAATCGLQLVTHAYTVQSPPTPNPNNATSNLPDPPTYVGQLTYSLNGWVTADSGTTTVDTQTAADDANGVDVPGPLAGGMWMQVGLLFDGTNLELFVDNRLVATQPLAATPKSLVEGAVPGEVAIGAYDSSPATDIDPVTVGAPTQVQIRDEIAIVPGSDDGTQQPTARWRMTTGTIDEFRIDRLGVDRAARLPSGVAANGDYRLTMFPDGRVDVSSSPLSFTTPGLGTVTVAVATDGAVTTTVTP